MWYFMVSLPPKLKCPLLSEIFLIVSDNKGHRLFLTFLCKSYVCRIPKSIPETRVSRPQLFFFFLTSHFISIFWKLAGRKKALFWSNDLSKAIWISHICCFFSLSLNSWNSQSSWSGESQREFAVLEVPLEFSRCVAAACILSVTVVRLCLEKEGREGECRTFKKKGAFERTDCGDRMFQAQQRHKKEWNIILDKQKGERRQKCWVSGKH